jgi:DNA (cytosine-5)-methyltransferase 1
MNTINHLDLFSGVGGFSLGLKEAGVQVGWHGFSDIDKFANNVFRERFPNAEELGSIETIDIDKLPKIDLVTFGFPCQDLSIAGKRKGFDGSRSSLYFKAIEIIERKRPQYFVFENVKGFFSSNAGKDFTIALKTIADIGYDGQWQLLNTRWFLPQNRERIYFVGHIRGECRPKVFPIEENDQELNNEKKIEVVGHSGTGGQRGDIYSPNGLMSCLSATDYKQPKQILNKIDVIGNLKGEGGHECHNVHNPNGVAPTVRHNHGKITMVDTGLNQIGVIGKDSEATRVYDTNCARTIKDGGGMGAKTGLYEIPEATKKGYAVAEEGDSINLSQPKSKTRRGRVGKGVAQTLDTGMQQYTIQSGIRRLTPTECERLQGFPDGWTEGQSDTQRYKQMGNAVSVPVVKSIMERLYDD